MKQRVVQYIFQQLQRSRKREFNADHIVYDKMIKRIVKSIKTLSNNSISTSIESSFVLSVLINQSTFKSLFTLLFN